MSEKRTNKKEFKVALAIVGILFFTSEFACSQVYQVGDLGGGLNLLDDSTNIAPNEALVMTNLVLDMPNVMSSRQGFSVLNSTVIDASEDINTIYIYEPYSGTQRMIIATNGGIYIMPSLADPGAIDWDTLKMGWEGESLSVANGSGAVYDLGSVDWWYSKMGTSDSIIINSVKYWISSSILADSLASLSPNYAGATDTVASYTVYRTTSGDVYFIQEGDRLYICAANQYPLVYDDTNYVYVALIDSGLVSDTTQLTDSTSYNRGKVHASISSFREFKFDSLASAICDSDWVGEYFTLHMRNERSGGDYIAKWTGIIEMMRQTPFGWQMWTATGFERNQRPFDYWNNYEVQAPLANCVADSGYAIEDTNKNWLDIDYGTEYLQDFYAVNGDHGIYISGFESMVRRIYCNKINTYSIAWGDTITYDNTDNYYIFTRIPRALNSFDSTHKEFPRFEQIFFYNKQLYGFGNDKEGKTWIRNLNYNRIWYSNIGESRDLGIMHRYIKPFYNFDIDLSENVSLMFKLRGRGYIASNNSIWSFTGIPSFGDGGGDLYYEKIISNNGIPDIDNWAKATEEYGYFANYDGIFRFDGIRATNISYDIDRAVKQYSGSECVLVYQSDRLYVSYPDSGITFIYREPLDKWYGPLGFGMTCAYAPVDTDIIYFGNPDYPGHVFFYPNGLNYDVAPDDDTLAIAWAYESGWQSLTDGPWNSKKLLTGYFPANTSDTFNVDIFADFATATADTFTWYPGGSSAHRFDNLSSVGDYFKVKIYGATKQGVVIRPYRIDWQEADMVEGN